MEDKNDFDLSPLINYFKRSARLKSDQQFYELFFRQAAEKLFISHELPYYYLYSKPRLVVFALEMMQQIINLVDVDELRGDFFVQDSHLDPIFEFDELFKTRRYSNPVANRFILLVNALQILKNPDFNLENRISKNHALKILAQALVPIVIDCDKNNIKIWFKTKCVKKTRTAVTRPFTGFNPLPGHNDRSVTRPLRY